MFVKSIALLILTISFLFPQGSVLLVGGGSENYNDWSDTPYQWLVSNAPNKKILVLHYSTASSFLPDYFKSLGALESQNLVIASTAIANDSATYKTILNYDAVFLRGGDQWQYISLWKGTLAEEAIRKIFMRGGAIGGTSAGAMVLSSIIADAKNGTVDPRISIKNPLLSGISFTKDFLGFVPNVICDTHFYERGRIARLLSMMALYHKQNNQWIIGLGVDDATAIGISSDGIGEIFGSGVVTFLRTTNITSYSLQSTDQLGLSNISLLQLTKGYKLQMQSGEILQTPSTASSYSPRTYSTQSPLIVLDGGNSTIEWTSSIGSISKFIQNTGNDSVAIFTTSPSSFEIESISSLLQQHSKPHRIVTLLPIKRFEQSTASELHNFGAMIFANIIPESLIYFTDTSSLTGNIFKQKLNLPMAFLGDAAAFSGEQFINKFELTTTAAYRGRLTIEIGLGVIKGMVIVPRIYESSDYVENRMSGFMWGIGKTMTSYGILLDNNSHLVIKNNLVEPYGSSPAVIVDLQKNTQIDFPTYIASGGFGTRQNAAIINAKISVVKDSTLYYLNSTTNVDKALNTFPATVTLHQNYPNPFNPITKISFSLTFEGFTTLSIYDVLGKTIATLIHQTLPSGSYTIPFSAQQLPSGLYYYTLRSGDQQITRKAVLIR